MKQHLQLKYAEKQVKKAWEDDKFLSINIGFFRISDLFVKHQQLVGGLNHQCQVKYWGKTPSHHLTGEMQGFFKNLSIFQTTTRVTKNNIDSWFMGF